ncbi:MAG: MBL fold metallo-hydrolase [Gemmatimonas sp.]|nr:MBL fold metallo-hydrolase [Gemmatimonas sp.]
MRPFRLALLVVCVAGAFGAQAIPLAAQGAPPGSDYEGQAFEFEQIRDDVYIARGTGALTVMSNAAIVINDEDVLVVDSHVSPAGAYALLRELREITTKPVRYVVNSHYHFDHSHGNQIYGPGVEIIGHEYTREAMATGLSLSGRTFARFLAPIPERVASMRAELDATSDPAAREELAQRLEVQENFLAATNSVEPTPPNVTLERQLTLIRGGNEIRIEFLGRGHTAGDVVVYLPEQRVLMTGDLFYSGLSYMGNAYIPDWIETLEKLKEFDFDVVLPGHGPPVRDPAVIDNFQAYLRDFWEQVNELHDADVPVEEAAARMDLRSHGENYPQIRSIGVDVDAVDRAYELIETGR